MKITQTESGGVKIVAVEGRLDTLTAPELEATLEAAAPGQLVLDLGKLEYISSAGLRVILAAARRQRASHGDLHIACLRESVGKVFEISGLNAIFRIHPDVTSAAASAQP